MAIYAWYDDARYDPDDANWVFPETDFYDRTVGNDGEQRQTFIVRFTAVTGEISTDDRQVILWDPSPDISFRNSGIFSERTLRPDRNPDQRRIARGILLGLRDSGTLTAAQREQLIGDIATDTVLARPVRQLAMYDVRSLASEVRRGPGIPPGFSGVDKGTGCLYRSPPAGNAPEPLYDAAAKVNQVIGEVADFYLVDRYSGQVIRLNRGDEE